MLSMFEIQKTANLLCGCNDDKSLIHLYGAYNAGASMRNTKHRTMKKSLPNI